MRQSIWVVGLVLAWLSCATACAKSVNVEQEQNALLARDREWSQTTKDMNKFVSFFASDASFHPPGMPTASGSAAIMETFMKITATPGFSVNWTPSKAYVSTAGDVGYTVGTYEATMSGGAEKGKYVTVWKRQTDGTWKVAEDIFNADTAGPPPSKPVMLPASGLTWADAPPVLPAGAKMAVVSGDPGKPEPFAIRVQLPSGYKIAPHWHPTDEHVTVLSGTFSLGMGEKFDQAALKDLSAGGYASMPAEMRHFATTKGATTIQVDGMGPFAVNYVNPADDPSKPSKKE
jgi:ketosteroid isomerase-like protein